MQRVVHGFVAILILAGCAASQQNKSEAPAAVWMQKPDGSKMCGFKEGIEPKKVADQLRALGINVLQAQKGNDGMMHTMMCGGASGDTVDVEVLETDAPKLKKLGFKLKQPL